MKICRVEWKLKDFTYSSQWYSNPDKAKELVTALEAAATALKADFEMKPKIVEVGVEE